MRRVIPIIGRACKRCGARERYANGRCIACCKADSRKWAAKHKDLAAQNVQDWRDANPDRVRETRHRYYEKNKEKLNARSKAWREAHPEQVRENHRRHRNRKKTTDDPPTQPNFHPQDRRIELKWWLRWMCGV